MIILKLNYRISVAPPFPGLRHFHEGRGFKQWTGDDSKGLMKVHFTFWVYCHLESHFFKQVYLPAIAGHVPPQMVQAVSALIEFCYLVRRSVINEDTLIKIDNALTCFHAAREIFREVNVRPDGFSLPRQHSLVHYHFLITQFGAPNGLCSSITESKHIKAVKKPYRRSSRNKPLGQMLVTNQRIDKLAAARVDFERRGMLRGAGLSALLLDDDLLPAASTVALVDEERVEDMDEGAIDDPQSLSEISLAKTYGMCICSQFWEDI